MANITDDDVLKLARLTKLQLTDEEVKHFRGDLQQVLSFVEQLQSINLDDYEPTMQVTDLHSIMREDVIKDYGPSPDDLLANAPATEKNQIKVKRVL